MKANDVSHENRFLPVRKRKALLKTRCPAEDSPTGCAYAKSLRCEGKISLLNDIVDPGPSEIGAGWQFDFLDPRVAEADVVAFALKFQAAGNVGDASATVVAAVDA